MVLEPQRRTEMPPCDYCGQEAAWKLQRLETPRTRTTLMACNRHRREAARTLRRPRGGVGGSYRITQQTLFAF